jgi:hypothetical protein
MEGDPMPRLMLVAAGALALVALVAPVAWTGNPHFITVSVTRTDTSLTVAFKEAGLGNEPQVHVVVSADAQCVNPGSNKPKAGNKQSFVAEGDFPVQNGKAEGTLVVTAAFQPDCSPPMTVVFSHVVITDTTSGISRSIPGTF